MPEAWQDHRVFLRFVLDQGFNPEGLWTALLCFRCLM